jgi:murein DD-endopeptidase MepM/ murein hydrolase activator NlpD
MQFIPSSWATYGVDANGDGKRDPYNPVDAIFAAARYLRAAGGNKNISQAIFAYNHADWYVQSVLLRAKVIGGMPADLVGSLTGLTQGHFPVAASATYADALNSKKATTQVQSGNAAVADNATSGRRSIDIFSRAGAPVVAVNDGLIQSVGSNGRLGRYVVLQDVYGNTYTYSHLGKISATYPAARQQQPATPVKSDVETPPTDARPSTPASAGLQARNPVAPSSVRDRSAAGLARPVKVRLFAHPSRVASYAAGGDQQVVGQPGPVTGYGSFDNYVSNVLGLHSQDVVLKPLKPGAQVIAGTILGAVDQTDPQVAPHVTFAVRPAGKGAPAIDPKPILDGWKLLEATAIYRANGKNPFTARLSGAGVLLLSKEALQRRVLADKGLSIYTCGREDIATGQIDRRVLAMLEYLRSKGFELTITSLKCGHGFLTTSGNVSEHTTGDAVDIAAIDGIPVTGHQGPGTLTDELIRDVLQLQGTMHPHQVISLEDLPGETSFALADHYDHVHIGYRAAGGNPLETQFSALLKPDQWQRLIARLGQIENPRVPTRPSPFSLPDKPSAGGGTGGGD